jgi:hypothetical protein
VRIELLFEGNTAYLSGFSSVINITFVEKSFFQVKGEALYVLLEIHQSYNQEGLAHSFLVRIELACERNTCSLKTF